MAKRKTITVSEWVNSLTAEQMTRVYDIIDPASATARVEYGHLSVEEILQLLGDHEQKSSSIRPQQAAMGQDDPRGTLSSDV